MSDDNAVAYVAVYDDVNDALSDLNGFEQLHDDQVVGKYDAAVIDQENGKPHIVKRVDRPRINVLPEIVGKGNLPSGQTEGRCQGSRPRQGRARLRR